MQLRVEVGGVAHAINLTPNFEETCVIRIEVKLESDDRRETHDWKTVLATIRNGKLVIV